MEKTHPLKAYRKRHGLTQLDIAKMVGVSKQMISMIEGGAARPSSHTAGLVERATDGEVTASELLFVDGLPDFPAARERAS